MKFQIVRFDAFGETVHPFGGDQTMRGQWSVQWDAYEQYFTVELCSLDDLLELAQHTGSKILVVHAPAPDLSLLEMVDGDRVGEFDMDEPRLNDPGLHIWDRTLSTLDPPLQDRNHITLTEALSLVGVAMDAMTPARVAYMQLLLRRRGMVQSTVILAARRVRVWSMPRVPS